MNFMLEAEGNGRMRFLYTEGERIFEHKNRQVYVYGTKGSFTAVEINRAAGRCRITQSTLGSSKTVYYLEHGSGYVVFTSLKLLPLIHFKRRFNPDREIVSEFLYNGFIRSRDTLVCGVSKLLPDERMEIECGKLKIRASERIRPDPRPVSLSEMYERESRIICGYIDQAVSGDGNTDIALSGGYDSNLILHFLKKRNVPVRAFSIGGRRGTDERETAAGLCGAGRNIRLLTGEVGPWIRHEYEKIVEILEGSMYERGIFLQYALAGLLKTHGVRSVLLGEGADQVFNRNFYDSREPSYLTNYNDNPYELGAMVVLKKSILMLDAFGITGLYPFICKQMQKLGAQVMEKNGTSKTRQKEMCRKFFDSRTNRLVDKKPGSTSLCALFRDPSEEEAFIAGVQKSNEFYDPSFRISYKYGPGESELDYYLCLEYLRLFKKIFCD